MKQAEIIPKIKSLSLPAGQYAVFGSGLLGIYGLREINDIDIVVTPKLYGEIKESPGWKEIKKPDGNYCVFKDDFEVLLTYKIGKYRPEVEDLIKMAVMVEGVAFVPLSEVLVWKNSSRRPKDLVDIALIEKFRAQQSS
jgi:hypothetical protein